jgi:hypothetical protein
MPRYNDVKPTRVVGSFVESRNEDFNNQLVSINETFKGSMGIDPIEDALRIYKDDVIFEQYKEMLLGDLFDNSQGDKYLDLLPAKIEQIVENSKYEIVNEAYGVSMLSPVVGYTLPIIKKNMLECIAKDVMMTEVPDAPVVKVAFERKFLKDVNGKKHYIPEIFYDKSFKEASELAKGIKVYEEAVQAPLEDYDLLTASMGVGNVRKGQDSFAYDLCIQEIVFNGAAGEVTVSGLNIKPDVERDGVFYKEVKSGDDRCILVGRVDFYNGTVCCNSLDGSLVSLKFGGHVSNQFNDRGLDLDRERIPQTWEIPEGERINTALTIEKIRDWKAMANIDITPDVVNDMATTLTQFEDSNALDFLEGSLDRWKDKTDLPFGYTKGFVQCATFDCNVTSGMLTQSDYIEKELKFRFNKLVSSLKDILKTPEIMFVAYGHPNNIELFNSAVKWIVDENTRVGGVQLDYKFGVMTETGNRIHFISSMKCAEDLGIRIVAYPTTANHITFKHYKYSFNIENTYRHHQVDKVPNIMGTHRYLSTEMLPVQAQLKLINNDFGIESRMADGE